MDFKGSSTVLSSGQIQIPKVLRAELGLEGGDRLIFYKTKKCGIVVEKSEVDI
jgi:AbrB family looped-hinge helix DNA binding protein